MEVAPPLLVKIGWFTYQYETVYVMSIVVLMLIAFAAFLTRRLEMVPGKAQAAAEFLVETFDELVSQAFGKKLGRRFLPWIGSLFLFMFLSNAFGIFPVPRITIPWGEMNLVLPAWEEPTRNYTVPITLAVLFIGAGHIGKLYGRGLWGYVKSYFEPVFFFFPLNIASAGAEFISISFRLFGNIFGGAVIGMIAFQLLGTLKVFPMPYISIAINMFFGLFVGLVQAFVFTMLAMTYSSVKIVEE